VSANGTNSLSKDNISLEDYKATLTSRNCFAYLGMSFLSKYYALSSTAAKRSSIATELPYNSFTIVAIA
jgi:hypothetical protein